MRIQRAICFPLGLIFVSSLCLQEVNAQGTSKKFNVLFISIDDLRPTLGCYGDKIAVTPNIDRLAKRGTVFNRAYSQLAVCSPSRASLLTGRRPDAIRVWDLKVHFRKNMPNVVTLPQHFKNQGYHTASIGKIFHGSGKPAKDPPSWSVPPLYDVSRKQTRRYALAKNLEYKGLKQSAAESADVADGYYIDGVVCETAVKRLAELQSKDQPFFLAVGFRKPHLPFCAPKKYWDLYDRQKIPFPASNKFPKNAPELAVRSWIELEGYSDIPSDGKITELKTQELRHGYYACVSYVDTLVGRLLDELERLNITEQTVVVLWSDHGFHLGEQGLWTKANNYELATRVPLIFSVPGQSQPGTTTDAFVELVDIYPTLAEVCNLKEPTNMDGRSMKVLLAKPESEFKKAVFSQFPRAVQANRHKGRGDIMGYSVRTKRYRYVEWRHIKKDKVIARELYDHQNDPQEMQNIADSIQQKQVVSKLEGILAKAVNSGSN